MNTATEQELLRTIQLKTEADSLEWSYNGRVFYCPQLGAVLAFGLGSAKLTVINEVLVSGFWKLRGLRKAIRAFLNRKETNRHNEQETKRLERLQTALRRLEK